MAKAGTKKSKGKKPKARVHLPAVSQTQQQAIMRDVGKLLAARGVVGKIVELRLSNIGAGTATATATATAAATECPPGMTKQVVCRKQPSGQVVCQEECV